jgi:hypothetical protein
VNDYFAYEMVKIRIDELREDAARAHAARRALGRRGWGIGLFGALSRQATGESVAPGAVKEICCA